MIRTLSFFDRTGFTSIRHGLIIGLSDQAHGRDLAVALVLTLTVAPSLLLTPLLGLLLNPILALNLAPSSLITTPNVMSTNIFRLVGVFLSPRLSPSLFVIITLILFLIPPLLDPFLNFTLALFIFLILLISHSLFVTPRVDLNPSLNPSTPSIAMIANFLRIGVDLVAARIHALGTQNRATLKSSLAFAFANISGLCFWITRICI